MQAIMWGEGQWLCAGCGTVDYGPEPPASCEICDHGETAESDLRD